MNKLLREPKRRGEVAELLFAYRAAQAGHIVSKPYGDSARFDFIVGEQDPVCRVQVRSTTVLSTSGAYICPFFHGKTMRRYTRDDFDVLAVYVIPRELWYLIPIAALLPARQWVRLYPDTPTPFRSHLEKYREAWHLLDGANPATR